MRRRMFLSGLASLLLLLGQAIPNGGSGRYDAEAAGAAKVDEAREVLEEILRIPEQAIPPTLLQNAEGIAIIPGVIMAGFILGGRHGSGVVLVRGKGGVWGEPREISVTSGSVGWQIGVQSTDLILVFKTRKSVDGMQGRKWTIGADLSAAAGPVGRTAEAKTDIWLKAEVLSYSRSRGLFAGISLDGGALSVGDPIKAPAAVARLKALLMKHAKPPR